MVFISTTLLPVQYTYLQYTMWPTISFLPIAVEMYPKMEYADSNFFKLVK